MSVVWEFGGDQVAFRTFLPVRKLQKKNARKWRYGLLRQFTFPGRMRWTWKLLWKELNTRPDLSSNFGALRPPKWLPCSKITQWNPFFRVQLTPGKAP